MAEYGDPVETHHVSDGGGEQDQNIPKDDQEEPEGAPVDQPVARPDYEELTEKQRKVIHTIYEHPKATQSELADILGFEQPTISQRVNTIEGFNWKDRLAFAEAMIANREPEQDRYGTAESSKRNQSDRDHQEQIEQIPQHVEALEERVSDMETQSPSVFENPELVRKLIHACIQADRITEEEELRIIQILLNKGDPHSAP